jgi:PBSX family phage terminase large subunit
VVAVVSSLDQIDATVQYWPRGASAELFRRHAPIVIISGPAGTGKTYGCLWRLHLAALKYPRMRGIMLRKVQEDLTASALVTYQERVLGAGQFNVRPFGGSKLKPAGFQYPNGSELLIGGLDKADKVMSREYDLIYVNEAWELSEDDLEKLSTRARWGVMPYQQVFGDTNPQGSGHHLYKAAQAGRVVMLTSVHEDNPVLYDQKTALWTEAGQAYLARLDALTGFRRDRLRLGLWTAAEGVVYPAFNQETHVRKMTSDELEGWAATLSLDVGTRNPTSLHTYRHAGERLHVERELYQRGMSSDQIVDAVADEYARSGATHVVVDPSAAGLIKSLTDRKVKVRKGINDILIGISRVTSILDTLTIDPSCQEMIDEFGNYRYPDGARSNADVPRKEFDHSMDELRYMVMDLYGKPQRADIAPVEMRQASTWRSS